MVVNEVWALPEAGLISDVGPAAINTPRSSLLLAVIQLTVNRVRKPRLLIILSAGPIFA